VKIPVARIHESEFDWLRARKRWVASLSEVILSVCRQGQRQQHQEGDSERPESRIQATASIDSALVNQFQLMVKDPKYAHCHTILPVFPNSKSFLR